MKNPIDEKKYNGVNVFSKFYLNINYNMLRYFGNKEEARRLLKYIVNGKCEFSEQSTWLIINKANLTEEKALNIFNNEKFIKLINKNNYI